MELSVNEKTTLPKIECKYLYDRMLLLSNLNIKYPSLIEYGNQKFLLDNLIIEDFEVVSKLQIPDGRHIIEPKLIPFFDLETLPYVIGMYSYSYYLFNLKQRSSQVLVDAGHRK